MIVSTQKQIVAASKKPKGPITERTEVKGLVDMEIPWVGGAIKVCWPATNRSIMVVICAMFCMLCVVLPLCCYIIFIGANPENVTSFGRLFRSEDGRKPEKIPVENANGDIEIIEVCPPCELEDCEDDCFCPTCLACPVQVPCPDMKMNPVTRDVGMQ